MSDSFFDEDSQVKDFELSDDEDEFDEVIDDDDLDIPDDEDWEGEELVESTAEEV